MREVMTQCFCCAGGVCQRTARCEREGELQASSGPLTPSPLHLQDVRSRGGPSSLQLDLHHPCQTYAQYSCSCMSIVRPALLLLLATLMTLGQARHSPCNVARYSLQYRTSIHIP